MGSQPPYRMPCGSVAGKPVLYIGNPFNHAPAPVLVDNYVNVTLVDNPAGGAQIPPYERYQCNLGGPVCQRNDCGSDPDKCTPQPNEAPCAPFNRAFPSNTFQKQGQTNFAVKHKTGFKAVQAKRYWNGSFGKTKDGPDNVVGCSATNNVSTWQSYQRVPRRSKYQQITVNAHYEFDWFDSSPGVESKETATSDCDYVQTLDPNSGVYTISGWNLSPGSYDNRGIEPPQYSNQALYKTSFAYWTLTDAVGRFTVPLTPGTTTYSANEITVTSGGQLVEDITWNINVGGTSTFDRYLYFYPIDRTTGLPVGQVMTRHEQCQISDTSIHYQDEEWDYGCAFFPPPPVSPFYSNIDVTGDLANEVKDSAIYNDVCGTGGLLDQWDLEDDEEYPWRTDTYVGVAPLVTRDEIQFTGWVQAPSFVINNFGVTWPNGDLSAVPGADIGSPDWDGITGVMPPTDPNSGVGYVAISMSAPGDFDGQSVGSPFSFNANPDYVSASSTLPPGVSFNGGTGPGSGTLSGNSSATGKYGTTITANSAPGFTGAIIGAPLPAGYGGKPSPTQGPSGYFQFGFEDWLGCCEDDGSGSMWTWYRHGWGMNSTTFNADVGFALPTNTTNWPNRWELINKPQGAWLFYNDQTKIAMPGDCDGTSLTARNADALWACKYAEIVDVWPSQNFARPAGSDKFSYDETQPVYGVNNGSGSGPGSTWQLYDANGNTISSASFPGIWGGKSVGGFYTGCSFSGGNVVLGAKVFNCPSDWQSAAGQQSGGRTGSDDSGICFGQLRFPNCPSLPGRAAITPDSTGKNMTFSPKQTSFGMSNTTVPAGQETVDLWDKDMNNLATAIVATRIDDTHFSVTGSYANAAYVTINGAAKWYMSDSDGKGDYALLEWWSDTRSQGEAIRMGPLTDCSGNPIGGIPSTNVGGGPIGNEFAYFTQTQGCVSFTPCGPKIICISPNGEFGTPYKFPPMLGQGGLPGSNNLFCFDEDYGSQWWGWFETTMTDLLWQAPHTPVGIIPIGNPDDYTLTWIEDQFNTGCPGDCMPGNPPCGEFEYQHWYRHEPQVETRLSVPCNYGQGQNECGPALPPGITIGWLSPVLYSGNDVHLPPKPPGILIDSRPGLTMTAWSIHAGMCADISAGCSLNYVVSGC